MKKIIVGIFCLLCMTHVLFFEQGFLNASEIENYAEIHDNSMDVVYVAERHYITNGAGTLEDPMLIEDAFKKVKDGGIIKIRGLVSYQGYGDEVDDPSAPKNKLPEKSLIFEGVDNESELHYRYSMVANGDLVFQNITLVPVVITEKRDLYLNGHNLKIDNIHIKTSASQQVPSIYAGSPRNEDVTQNNQLLEINSGEFAQIYAGGEGTSKGDVEIRLSKDASISKRNTGRENGIYSGGFEGGSMDGNVSISLDGNVVRTIELINGTKALSTSVKIANEESLNTSLRLQQVQTLSLENAILDTSPITGLTSVHVDEKSTWKINMGQTIRELICDGTIMMPSTGSNTLVVEDNFSGKATFKTIDRNKPVDGVYIKVKETSDGSFVYSDISTLPPLHMGATFIEKKVGAYKEWTIQQYERSLNRISLSVPKDEHKELVLKQGRNTETVNLKLESFDQFDTSFLNTSSDVKTALTIQERAYQDIFIYEPWATYSWKPSDKIIKGGLLHARVTLPDGKGSQISSQVILKIIIEPTLTATATITSIKEGESLPVSIDLNGVEEAQGTLLVHDKDKRIIYQEIAVTNSHQWTPQIQGLVEGKHDLYITFEPADGTYIKSATSSPISIDVQESALSNVSVSLNKTSLQLKKGNSEVLMAQVLPQALPDKTIRWSSRDASIARVSQDGEVEAISAGSTIIEAQAFDGTSATCEVNVVVPLESISFTQHQLSLIKGGTQSLQVLFTPTDTTYDKEITWSSDAPTIASVNTQGVIQAHAAGKTRIVATTKQGLQTSCEVHVIVKAESIELKEKMLKLHVGDTVSLSPTLIPSDTTNTATYTYQSEQTRIASIDSLGNISALAIGTTKIQIMAILDTGETLSTTVHVLVEVNSRKQLQDMLTQLQEQEESLQKNAPEAFIDYLKTQKELAQAYLRDPNTTKIQYEEAMESLTHAIFLFTYAEPYREIETLIKSNLEGMDADSLSPFLKMKQEAEVLLQDPIANSADIIRVRNALKASKNEIIPLNASALIEEIARAKAIKEKEFIDGMLKDTFYEAIEKAVRSLEEADTNSAYETALRDLSTAFEQLEAARKASPEQKLEIQSGIEKLRQMLKQYMYTKENVEKIEMFIVQFEEAIANEDLLASEVKRIMSQVEIIENFETIKPTDDPKNEEPPFDENEDGASDNTIPSSPNTGDNNQKNRMFFLCVLAFFSCVMSYNARKHFRI